ncbi:MAG: hypothetical protein MZV64_32230 [Ignavibacteriales bacterium]|nr:hypothetical protein [Ignavibacteriales bacterium]
MNDVLLFNLFKFACSAFFDFNGEHMPWQIKMLSPTNKVIQTAEKISSKKSGANECASQSKPVRMK